MKLFRAYFECPARAEIEIVAESKEEANDKAEDIISEGRVEELTVTDFGSEWILKLVEEL